MEPSTVISPLHYYHDGTRADEMVEGGKQGGVAASHLAALALQPVLDYYLLIAYLR